MQYATVTVTVHQWPVLSGELESAITELRIMSSVLRM